MLVCNKCRRIEATEKPSIRSIDGVLLCARCADLQANPPLPLAVYVPRATVAIATGAVAALVALCALALLAIVVITGPIGQSAGEALSGPGYSWALPLLMMFIAGAALVLGLPLLAFYVGAYVASLLWPSSRRRRPSTDQRNA